MTTIGIGGQMRELDFEPDMVGRENELRELQGYLDRAAKGQGSTPLTAEYT